MDKKKVAAVCADMGGTYTKLAAITPDGTIIKRDRFSTAPSRGWKQVTEELAERMKCLSDTIDMPVCGFGLGIAGVIDLRNGTIVFSPNFPGWEGAHVKESLMSALGTDVLVENDADAVAYGEGAWGVARGIENYICITLGTGIGGGLVLNGHIWHGPVLSAGEVGHFPVFGADHICGCGNRGCLETVASASAVAREAREVVRNGRSALLQQLSGGRPDLIDAAMVAEAASRGDAASMKIFEKASAALGQVIAGLLNLLHLEAVIIGGGMAGAWEIMSDLLRKEISSHLFPRNLSENFELLSSKMKDDAGPAGMARFVFEKEGIPIP